MKNIFLVGFMGAGKTTFGKKLANRLKMEFFDLDHSVAQQFGKEHVSELIEEKGFDFFREVEAKGLKSIKGGNKVIATGGGTPCYHGNMDWMKQNGIVLFLNPGDEVIHSRLKTTDFSSRPLLKDLDEQGLLNFIREKMGERIPFYSKADITFNPVRDNMSELLEKIERENK